MSYIYAIEDNTSDEQAHINSFWQNEGMNNNDYDRCMFYVYQYKYGKEISELSNDSIKPTKVREYIRWGLFLEPSIIKISNNIITREAKNEMVNYDHKFQLEVLNNFLQIRKPKEKLKKDTVEFFTPILPMLQEPSAISNQYLDILIFLKPASSKITLILFKNLAR